MGLWERITGGSDRKNKTSRKMIELPPRDENGKFIPRSKAAARARK